MGTRGRRVGGPWCPSMTYHFRGVPTDERGRLRCNVCGRRVKVTPKNGLLYPHLRSPPR